MEPQNRRIRVLVVEDDPDDLFFLDKELKSHPLVYTEPIIVDDRS